MKMIPEITLHELAKGTLDLVDYGRRVEKLAHINALNEVNAECAKPEGHKSEFIKSVVSGVVEAVLKRVIK